MTGKTTAEDSHISVHKRVFEYSKIQLMGHPSNSYEFASVDSAMGRGKTTDEDSHNSVHKRVFEHLKDQIDYSSDLAPKWLTIVSELNFSMPEKVVEAFEQLIFEVSIAECRNVFIFKDNIWKINKDIFILLYFQY